MAIANRVPPESYRKFVREFPLIHIVDDEQFEQAKARLDGLLTQELDGGGEAYRDALTDLIEIFERANEVCPDASPQDVLAELMSANRIGQKALADAVGIAQSTISAILTGKRKLTTEHLLKLASYFHVPPAVFLPG